MTVDERLLAAELRQCSLGFFSQARNFVCDVHAKPAGFELSDRQKAYLFYLGYRFRKQLPEYLAERCEEFRQRAAALYAQPQGVPAYEAKTEKVDSKEAAAISECSSQLVLFSLPALMDGGFLG
jgi:hypothetical protein